ncbi:hypothetical protein l13_13330 [Neisseria weaveri ATCC 51223]|nr:hypothetical protein l13_13330 [Neisseria weaveri ATCC 51223]
MLRFKENRQNKNAKVTKAAREKAVSTSVKCSRYASGESQIAAVRKPVRKMMT